MCGGRRWCVEVIGGVCHALYLRTVLACNNNNNNNNNHGRFHSELHDRSSH